MFPSTKCASQLAPWLALSILLAAFPPAHLECHCFPVRHAFYYFSCSCLRLDPPKVEVTLEDGTKSNKYYYENVRKAYEDQISKPDKSCCENCCTCSGLCWIKFFTVIASFLLGYSIALTKHHEDNPLLNKLSAQSAVQGKKPQQEKAGIKVIHSVRYHATPEIKERSLGEALEMHLLEYWHFYALEIAIAGLLFCLLALQWIKKTRNDVLRGAKKLVGSGHYGIMSESSRRSQKKRDARKHRWYKPGDQVKKFKARKRREDSPVSSMAPSSAMSSAVPSSAAPSSAVPSSAIPSSAAPSSVVPSSAAPSSAVPSSAVPSSAVPSSAPASSKKKKVVKKTKAKVVKPKRFANRG